MKLLAVAVGFLIPLLVAAVVAVTGLFNVSATSPPGRVEAALAGVVLDQSVGRRAPKIENPRRNVPGLLGEGLSHFRTNCLPCHGAPGVPRFEFGEGLNPAPPDLVAPGVQDRSDGELFWIVRHGIRMTGMPAFAPTHTDEEIWSIVAFVRHLPELGPEERDRLAATAAEQEHHHEKPAEEKPVQEKPVQEIGEEEQHTHPPGTPPHTH